MNITVYCGSKFGNQARYRKDAEALGTWIGQNGHRLIYGGGWTGLMGAVSNAALKAGGEVYGIIPEFLKDIELAHDGLTKTVTVETMAERKTIMREEGDFFIALPGGPGTIEEITEIISLRKLKRHDKPAVFYNCDHFYDSARTLYRNMVTQGFLDQATFDTIVFADNLEAIYREVEREIAKRSRK